MKKLKRLIPSTITIVIVIVGLISMSVKNMEIPNLWELVLLGATLITIDKKTEAPFNWLIVLILWIAVLSLFPMKEVSEMEEPIYSAIQKVASVAFAIYISITFIPPETKDHTV